MLKRVFFLVGLLFSSGAFALQSDEVSVYVSGVTLGDIWVLQFVLGLVQCALLGAIHGHQR